MIRRNLIPVLVLMMVSTLLVPAAFAQADNVLLFVQIEEPAENGEVSTSEGSMTVRGKSLPGAVVEIRGQKTTANPQGAWSMTIAAPPRAGVYRFEAVASYGGQKAVAGRSFQKVAAPVQTTTVKPDSLAQTQDSVPKHLNGAGISQSDSLKNAGNVSAAPPKDTTTAQEKTNTQKVQAQAKPVSQKKQVGRVVFFIPASEGFSKEKLMLWNEYAEGSFLGESQGTIKLVQRRTLSSPDEDLTAEDCFEFDCAMNLSNHNQVEYAVISRVERRGLDYMLVARIISRSMGGTLTTLEEKVGQNLVQMETAQNALGKSIAKKILEALPIIWIFLYFIALFFPNVLGNYRPYTFAKPAWFIMRALGWFFYLPGSFSNFSATQIMKFLGHDQRTDFLTDEQRARLDADTSREAEENVLEEDEKEMIRNIFDFGETPVKEIMTPRVNMVGLEVGTDLEKTLETLNEERHSRVPVFKESPDNVVGILYNRDFLEWYSKYSTSETQEFHLGSLTKPAYFVPITKKIDDLMRELRKSRNQLAIVVDEYGGTAGVVTLEDILEEIVGEIHDEDDVPEDAKVFAQEDGSWHVDPVISLGDLQDELSFQFNWEEEPEVESLSGLIQSTLGHIPKLGEQVEIPPLKIKVEKTQGQRIEMVSLELTSQ